MSIHLRIITPERIVYEDDVDAISLPTTEGEITILPNHIPLVTLLGAGVITLKKKAEEQHIASQGGFLEVLPNSGVNILADSAERAIELHQEKVEEAKKRAEDALREKQYSDETGHAALLGNLERELARLKALRKERGSHHAGTHQPHIESEM